MASYVEKDLGQNEWIVQTAAMHWAYLLPDILLCFFLIGFVTLPINIIKRRTTELAFTNKRLLGKLGVFNIDELDIPLNQVRDIRIKSNLIGKLCGFGTITITMGSRRVPFVAVRHPEKFKKALREQAELYEEEQANLQMAASYPWAAYNAQMAMPYPWVATQPPTWGTYSNWYYPPQQY